MPSDHDLPDDPEHLQTLVQALRRKVRDREERIERLEDTIEHLRSGVDQPDSVTVKPTNPAQKRTR